MIQVYNVTLKEDGNERPPLTLVVVITLVCVDISSALSSHRLWFQQIERGDFLQKPKCRSSSSISV